MSDNEQYAEGFKEGEAAARLWVKTGVWIPAPVSSNYHYNVGYSHGYNRV